MYWPRKSRTAPLLTQFCLLNQITFALETPTKVHTTSLLADRTTKQSQLLVMRKCSIHLRLWNCPTSHLILKWQKEYTKIRISKTMKVLLWLPLATSRQIHLELAKLASRQASGASYPILKMILLGQKKSQLRRDFTIKANCKTNPSHREPSHWNSDSSIRVRLCTISKKTSRPDLDYPRY